MAEPWQVTLSWDNRAKAWYVWGTNFPGLDAKACTAPALVIKIQSLAPELFHGNLYLFQD